MAIRLRNQSESPKTSYGANEHFASIEKIRAQEQKDKEAQDKQIRKNRSGIESGIKSYGSFHYEGLLDIPEARSFVVGKSEELIDEGEEPREAYKQAFKEYLDSRGKKKSSSLSSPPGGSSQRESGTASTTRSILSDALLGGAQNFQRTRKNVQNIGSLAANHPGQFAAAVGIEPIEQAEGLVNLISHGDPLLGRYLRQDKPRLAEKLKEASGINALSPEHREAAENVALISGLIPLGGPLGAIAKGIKGTKFEAILSRLFAKRASQAGRAAEEVAEEAFRAAEKSGVDLGKVAAGDAEETERLFKVISSEETPTVARAERVQRKSSKFVESEAQTLREEQIKAHPRHEAEVEDAVQRKIDQIQKDTPVPGGRGEINQANRSKLALIKYPKVRESYQKATANMHAYEDAYVNAKTAAQKAEIEPRLMAARRSADEAEEALRRNIADAKGRSPRATPETTRETAQNKITKLQNDIAEGKEIELSKKDYNPERIAEAKSIEKKKPLPGKPKEDFLHKVHDEYQQVYQKRLDEINDHLAKPVRVAAEGLGRGRLLKEKSVLEKLIEHAKADKTIHTRHLQARELAARKRIEEQTKALIPVKELTPAAKKAEEVASRIKPGLEDYIKNPSQEKLSALAKETGAPESAIQKTKSLAEHIGIAKENPSPSRLAKLKNEINDFFDAFKTKDWDRISHNPIALGAIQIAGDVVGLPWYISSAAFGRGRNPWVRTFIFSLYKGAKHKIVPEYKKMKYKSAIEKGDYQEIARLKKKYGPKLAKEASAELNR